MEDKNFQNELFRKLQIIEAAVAKSNFPHLTKRETAQFFGISVNCVTDWTRKGILTAYHVANRVYYKREELEQVLFNRKTA